MIKICLCLSIAGLILASPVIATPEETPGNPVCRIKTSMGDIFVALFPKEAPKTVQNFVDLAEGKKEFTDIGSGKKVKRPFYDGLVFHRVIKDFMIQGGCQSGDGTSHPGYKFEDEINAISLGLDKIKVSQPDGTIHPFLQVRTRDDYSRIILGPLYRKMGIKTKDDFEAKKAELMKILSAMTLKEAYENQGYQYQEKVPTRHPKRGVIAMANSGPNSNGSQFFINLVDTPWLAGKHTVFGEVVKGMEIVDKIGNTPVDARSKPISEVKIISIRIDKGKPEK
jgi:peptidyl-prolyl cis-trans isomerase A (cyclophilin A)